MEPVIRTENLFFSYPDGTRVLQDLNLQVLSGERVALLGPNGSGKSTLLFLLLGFLWPDKGEILLFGHKLTRGSAGSLRSRMGIVFQDPDDQLFCPTLKDDVAFGPRNFGLSGADLEHCVKEALLSVGLWEKRGKEPYRLSQGEKKRAALATILAMKPEILLLDEPSAHLDPGSREKLLSVGSELKSALILATQDLLLAASLCTRAVVLSEGTKVLDASMDDLLSGPERLAEVGLPFLEICRFCSRYGWYSRFGGRVESS